jgi:hypothetical protein
MLFATKVASTKSHDELMLFATRVASTKSLNKRMLFASKVGGTKSHDERMLFTTKVASTNIPKPYFRSFDVTSLANHREGLPTIQNVIALRSLTEVSAYLMTRFVTAKALMSLEVTLNA